MTTATINPFGSRRSRAWAPWAGFTPGMLIFGIFGLVPALSVVVLSLTNITGIPGVPWNWVGIDNYTRFFSGPQSSVNWEILLRTLTFCLAVTVVQNALALLVAVLLNIKLRGSVVARSIIFLPVVLGVTIIGLTWSLFFNPTGGPGAAIWGLFGAESTFFGSPTLAFPLIIMVSIWSSLGFSMMIFLAGLQAIPADLYEAARVDGAGAAQQLRHVTIPMLAPAITANVLISIIGALQSYQLIYVLGGVNNPTTEVLALKLFTTAFSSSFSGQAQEQGYASAISMIQFVLVAVVALLALGPLRRRETDL